MMDAVPSNHPSAIIVERASDSASLIMVGIILTGDQQALIAAAAAARAAGFAANATTGVNDEPETMILFFRETPRASAIGFMHRAQRGAFGSLRVKLVLGDPQSVLAEAPNWVEQLDVEPVEYVRDPSE
jgi:hypothetical protein